MSAKRIVVVVLSGLALAAAYWIGHSAGVRGRASAPPSAARGGVVTPATEVGRSRQILYYRNPMGLNDTSPVPKKDAMGMDYVPVYADEVSSGEQVKISLGRLQTLGVKTDVASRRSLKREIRAVGTVEASEGGLYSVSPKFEGWITTLFVNTTGAAVRRGQPLFAVYSPELVTAQEEYRVAVKTLEAMSDSPAESRANMESLREASLQRLRNWDIADVDLVDLRNGSGARRSLVIRSPTDGVVVEKAALAGMRFMAGEPLFRIADLSSVWIVANVFEQDLALVRPGQTAVATLTAYPGRKFPGKVTFVYPTVQAETRTGRIRIELPNPDGSLKPLLYGTVAIEAAETVAAVAVPESAVLDSGTRQLVLIDLGGGAFEPRAVELGSRGDGYVEAVNGLRAGERVVVDGNFLIDAESNLKAALGSMSGHSHGEATPRGPDSGSASPGPESPAEAARMDHAGH